MYRRSLAAAAARAWRVPTGAPRAVAARAVGTSAPTDAPMPLRSDAAGVAEPPLSPATIAAIARETCVSASNYASIPVVIARAKGVHVWDVDGKCYLDALSGYSAVNQGHAHPNIVAALAAQAATLGLVSRAFHSARYAEYAEAITSLFGYDKARARGGGASRAGAFFRVTRQRCPRSAFLRRTLGAACEYGGRHRRNCRQALPPLVSETPQIGRFGARLARLSPSRQNKILRRKASGPTAARLRCGFAPATNTACCAVPEQRNSA